MKNRLLVFVVGGLALATPAFAQDDDAPYAYPDSEETPTRVEDAPERSSQRYDDGEDEEKDFRSMARMDDPNTGVAWEAVAGAMMLDSSRGQLGELSPGVGARFTWEYGRLFAAEPWDEALWFDVQWLCTWKGEGTQLVRGDTHVHYFTLAPAYELTFGKSDWGLYGQVGGGISWQVTSLTVGSEVTPVNGMKPLIQYGVGLRGRPRLSADGSLRLAVRLGVTGFRRGYMNDAFFSGSVGLAF